jgi:superfamily II DNA helicase RecQ
MSEREAGTSAREDVRRELAKLPDDWFVFHDLPLGPDGATLDHLVIGSGGVFTLSTKDVTTAVKVGAHTILVGGRSTQFVRRARIDAGLVTRQLQEAVRNPVRVNAAIVFVNGCDPISSVVGDVTVLALDVLAARLVSLRSAINPKIVASIARAVELPATFVAAPEADASTAVPEATGDLGTRVNALKAWRKQRATADRVPVHVVLNDSHLAGIATTSPKTLEELGHCPGVGPAQLERYGDEILSVVTDIR